MKLFNKVLSLTLVLLMLAGMMVIPAYAEETIPSVGVYVDEDFEGYDLGQYIPLRKDGGQFTRRVAYPALVDGNMVWNVNPPEYPGNGANHLLFEWGAAGYGNQQVDTGKLVYEYDVYYPTPADGKQLGEKQRTGHYIATYNHNWNGNSPNAKRAFLTYSQMVGVKEGTEYKGHIAQIWFPTIDVGGPQGAPDESTRPAHNLELDQWHHITHFIDFGKGEVYHYINGKHVATSTDKVKDNFAFDEIDIYTNCSPAGLSADFTMYMDNVKIQRISGEEPFDAEISEIGADYIDVKFSKTTDLSRLTAADFSLRVFGGETIGAPTAVKAIGTTVRLSYALDGGKSYELFMNKAVPESLNPENVIPAGTKFSFTTSAETVDTVLLDLDFEDVTWPENAEGKRDAEFVEVYNSYMPGEDQNTNPSVYGQYDNWKFLKESREDLYVKPITFKGSTMMEVDMKGGMSLAQSANDVVIPFNGSASDGILEVSFDAVKSSAGSYQLGFGLRDTAYSAVDAPYNPMSDRSTTTLFGGYTYWSGWQSSLVASYEDAEYRNQLPDGYAYPGNPGTNASNANKPNTGKWKDVASAALIEKSFKPVSGLENNVIRNWKFVIDLDNETYDIYLDGALKKSMAYLPGGEAGTYDAFSINSMLTTGDKTFGVVTKDRSTLIDNVKVVHRALKPMITGATVEKYDGTQSGMEPVLSAGTKQLIVHFGKEMDEATFGYITVEDAKGTAYTVEKDGRNAVINFTNCLAPNTAYTVTVGADVADKGGMKLGAATVFNFTTDAGEVVYNAPAVLVNGDVLNVASSITLGQAITAESEIINTAGEDVNAYIVIGSYKNTELVGIKYGKYNPILGLYNEKASVTFSADENFVDADELKAYLIKDLTDFTPLADYTSIYGGNTAKAVFGSAEPEEVFMDAYLPTGVTANVVNVGGRTGWKLIHYIERESYISFDVDELFMDDMKAEDSVTVMVDYYDDGVGGFGFLYNNENDEPEVAFQQLTNTKTWKTASLDVYGAAFNGSDTLWLDDCRIIITDGKFSTDKKRLMGESSDPVVIGAVKIKKNAEKAPFEIVEETPHAGNAFFAGEEMTFVLNYNDISSTGNYTEADVAYTVYNFDGAKVWETTSAVVDNVDTITVPELPYGVYTLVADITAPGVKQREYIDFSYSLQAEESNMKFGTNVHFDYWEAFDNEDVDAQLELIKASGYGFVRTKVEWIDVEPNGGGVYRPLDIFWYGNQRADELGLEILAILGQGNGKYDEYPYFLEDEADRAAYARACAWVVSQLKQYTDYYTNPNEMDLFYPEDYDWSKGLNAPYYVAYSKAANEAIYAEHPEATIISGAVSGPNLEWAELAYQKGILDSCDGFSGHHYHYTQGPEGTALERFTAHRDLIREYSADDEVWVTENGWTTLDYAVAAEVRGRCTEIQQAKWLVRSLGIFSNPDLVDKYFHYCFVDSYNDYFDNEGNFGIVHAHDYRTPYSAKPAFIAVTAYHTIVGEAEFFGNQKESGKYYDYKYVTKGGEEVYMLWREDSVANKTYTFTTDKPQLEIYDMYGNKTVVDVNGSYDLTITDQPIYVKAID